MTWLILSLAMRTQSIQTTWLDRSSIWMRNSARVVYTIQKSKIENGCSNLYLVWYNKKKSYALYVSSCINWTWVSNTRIGVDYKNLLISKLYY